MTDGNSEEVAHGGSEDEAAWLDLIGRFDAPAYAGDAPAPWPDSENLPAPPAGSAGVIPDAGSAATESGARPAADGGVAPAPPADGGITSAPARDGGITSAPAGDGGITSAPAGDGGITSAPAGDGGITSAPARDGITSGPARDGGITSGPARDGGITSPPAGDGGAAPAPGTDMPWAGTLPPARGSDTPASAADSGRWRIPGADGGFLPGRPGSGFVPVRPPGGGVPAPPRGGPDADPLEEEHFVPPPPPPLPQLSPVQKGAWVALFGGPGYLLVATVAGWSVPGWLAICAIAAFVGGFTALVLHLGDNHDRDSDPDDDDGAVV